MDSKDEGLRKAVRLFLEEGLNLSPGMIKVLSESEDPIKFSTDLLTKIESSGKEISVLTEEIYAELTSPVIVPQTSSNQIPVPLFKEEEKAFGGLVVKEDWSFAKAKTDLMTHGLHPYPARMIPQIAERLINRYSSPGSVVLDPFCGSGTVLVESCRNQRNTIGNDINPLAVLLAKVKSKRMEPKRLNKAVSSFIKEVEEDYKKQASPDELPSFRNIRHWFKDFVIKDLSIILHRIKKVQDVDIRKFLEVCFSLTVLETSNIDHRSSRFIRILHKEELEKHRPEVLPHFRKKTRKLMSKVALYYQNSYNTSVDVVQGDAQRLPLSNETIDLIVTSPPYGEERNTVAYSRWTKLMLYWLGYDQTRIKSLEKGSLGGAKRKTLETPSETANKVLEKVAKIDKKRATEAVSFFFDYRGSLEELYRVLKLGCRCCIVIGNRSIKRFPVAMDVVTIELGKTIGFSHEKTYYRDIPKKLIPWTTPTGATIFRENIVILLKE